MPNLFQSGQVPQSAPVSGSGLFGENMAAEPLISLLSNKHKHCSVRNYLLPKMG